MNDPKAQRQLDKLVTQLRACTLCPKMHRPAVSGGAILSPIMTVGQAPGGKEPVLGRPFAWTAGRTLFRWFEQASGLSEAQFRAAIYMAAVCRCFPGKNATGGDRVPDSTEILTCGRWLDAELKILRPRLVIPIGKLAIGQFLPTGKLTDCIGKRFTVERLGQTFDVVPLPHPSGASTWHRMEPGLSLLREAMAEIIGHPAWKEHIQERSEPIQSATLAARTGSLRSAT